MTTATLFVCVWLLRWLVRLFIFKLSAKINGCSVKMHSLLIIIYLFCHFVYKGIFPSKEIKRRDTTPFYKDKTYLIDPFISFLIEKNQPHCSMQFNFCVFSRFPRSPFHIIIPKSHTIDSTKIHSIPSILFTFFKSATLFRTPHLFLLYISQTESICNSHRQQHQPKMQKL